MASNLDTVPQQFEAAPSADADFARIVGSDIYRDLNGFKELNKKGPFAGDAFKNWDHKFDGDTIIIGFGGSDQMVGDGGNDLLAKEATERNEELERWKSIDPERLAAAEILAPSVAVIESALANNPGLVQRLKDNHLQFEPESIRHEILRAIFEDTALSNADLTKWSGAPGGFPILAGFVGLGAITADQRTQLLSIQKRERDEWLLAHPDGDVSKHFRSGDLLRDPKFVRELNPYANLDYELGQNVAAAELLDILKPPKK